MKRPDNNRITVLYERLSRDDELNEYLEHLRSYAYHIETCGEERNSYSKTDHDATFMRLKCDYMGNNQLLPAYNLQAAICDEYIAVNDVKPYASDMEYFVPLMEKFIQRNAKTDICHWSFPLQCWHAGTGLIRRLQSI